ncbi:MAG: protein-disulfide reductase DsbD family protein [Dongiaceae bacterium]
MKKNIIFQYIAIIFALCFAANLHAAYAEEGASNWGETPHGKVRLISHTKAVEDNEIWLGLEFELEKEWKIYWRSPGDAGFPPQINWQGSNNLAGAEILWPAPERFSAFNLETVGYHDHIILPIKASLLRSHEPLQLRANVSYLTCRDICIPYKVDLQLDIPAGPALPSTFAGAINEFIARVPGKSSIPFEAFIKNGEEKSSLHVAIHRDEGFVSPDLFIEHSTNAHLGKPELMLSADAKTALFTVPIDAAPDRLQAQALTFTLVDKGQGVENQQIPEWRNEAPAPSFLWILLLGLIGGFILNFMPCVLPVLSIKLLKVAHLAGAEQRQVRLSFLYATAGIIVSFLLLAALAIAIKSAGMFVGWGMQFQSPVFLIIMMAICLIFAANLSGLFEIPLPAFIGRLGGNGFRQGHIQDFLSGMLATLLATPCSAPFLGTALGFALSQGPKEILSIFTAVGLGLALPYILVALVPRIVATLPRPGPWMKKLKIILALALLATGIWLGSVAATQILYDQNKSADVIAWQDFAPEKIPMYVMEGKTVFVDVTAAWCLTCQVNKKLVLHRADIQRQLQAPNVVAMQGDWTKPDAKIASYLASFNRYGIPFNAVYGPKAPEGIALPELLTENAVAQALTKTQ